MENPTLNPIEKLAKLAAQRTVRTDRLHAAVRELTDALETAGARPGEIDVTVDGWTLSYRDVRSNVGVRDCWSWGTGRAEYDERDGCTDLGLAVGHEGYLHGDFGAWITGPSRAHLIAFGQRAGKIVAAIVRMVEAEDKALESALANVSVAIESQ